MDLPAVSPVDDEELKELQSARREQLEQVYEQQEYARRENRRAMDSYFETSELLNETAEMLAENSTFIHADPVKVIVYKHTPAVQARHTIEDEGLPFEVKGDKLSYTGKNPEEFMNASWDLAAALADRAPYVLENNSIGDVDWLEKHVDGFAATNKTECQRLQQKEVLIDSRIMRTDGTLTEKGHDMVDEMHAEAQAAEQDIKGLEAEEQELYADFEHSSSTLMADTAAVAASLPFLMLPIYLVAKRAIDKGKHSNKAKVKAVKETEYNLAKVGKKGKGGDVEKRWYQTTAGKAGIVFAAGTMVLAGIGVALNHPGDHQGNHPGDHQGNHTGKANVSELPAHVGDWGISNVGTDNPNIQIGSLHYPPIVDGVKIHDSKPEGTPMAVVHTGEIGWLNETNDPKLLEQFESWAGKEALERGLDAAKAQGANETYVEMTTKQTPDGRTVSGADIYLYNNQTPHNAPPQNNTTADSFEIYDKAADPSIAVNGSNLSLPAKLLGLTVVNESGLKNYNTLKMRSLGLLGRYEKGENNGTLEGKFKAQATKEGWERGVEAAQRKGGATALFVNMTYKDAGGNKTDAYGDVLVLRDKSLGGPDCDYDFGWDPNVTRADIWVDENGALHYPKSIDNITIVSNMTGYDVNKWDKVPIGPVNGSSKGTAFDMAKALAMEVGLEEWFAGQKGGDAVYARLQATRQAGGSNLTLELAQLAGGNSAWEYWVWDNPGKEVPMKKPFTNNLLGKMVVESQFLPKVSWWRGDTKANKTSYQDFENETTKEIKARGQVAADAIESTLRERGLLKGNETGVDEIFYEVRKVYDPDKPDTVTMGADLKLVRLPRTVWIDPNNYYNDIWVEPNGTVVKYKPSVSGVLLALDGPVSTWKEMLNITENVGYTEVSRQLRDFDVQQAKAQEKAAEAAVRAVLAKNGTFNDSETGKPAVLQAAWPELVEIENGTNTDFKANLHLYRLPRTLWNDTHDYYPDIWVEKNGTEVKQKQYIVDGIRLKLDGPGETWKELRNETVYIGSTEISQQLHDFETILAQAREKAAEKSVMRTRALNGTFNDSATGMPAWLTAVWPELIQKQNGTKTDFEAKLHFARHWDWEVQRGSITDYKEVWVDQNGSLHGNGTALNKTFYIKNPPDWSKWDNIWGQVDVRGVKYRNEDLQGTAPLGDAFWRMPGLAFVANLSRELALEAALDKWLNESGVDNFVLHTPSTQAIVPTQAGDRYEWIKPSEAVLVTVAYPGKTNG
jgi:hypothetical protein